MLMPNCFQFFWHINKPVPSLFLSKTDQNIPEGISSDIFNNDFLSRDKEKKERVLQSSQSASKRKLGLPCGRYVNCHNSFI